MIAIGERESMRRHSNNFGQPRGTFALPLWYYPAVPSEGLWDESESQTACPATRSEPAGLILLDAIDLLSSLKSSRYHVDS
jgi:hypothetical protein